jgi:hypothetical protein
MNLCISKYTYRGEIWLSSLGSSSLRNPAFQGSLLAGWLSMLLGLTYSKKKGNHPGNAATALLV